MDITRGSAGFGFSYLLVLAPMVFAMIRGGAARERLLVSPAVAFAVMLLAAIVIMMTSFLLEIFGFLGHLLRLPYGIAVMAAMGYVAGQALTGLPSGSGWQVLRRGASVCRPEPVFVRRPDPASPFGVGGGQLTLGGVPVASEDETLHFKLIGATGTGKSTGIRQLLSGALGRGDRAVIADPDGGYLARFYDPNRGDIILNPFHKDAHRWDLFGEISEPQDVDQIASALIPEPGDLDRVWQDHARTFLIELMRQSIRSGKPSDRELFHLVMRAPLEELRALLTGTSAGSFLEVGNERMFGSVRSTASTALRSLEHTILQNAAPFSVRRWVEGRNRMRGRGGVLFLPYKAGEIAALRSMISAWMRIAIFEAMNREEGDHRLWFVVDELDALGAIDGLKDALARLRKFGGRCVLGFQSIAQVSGTYGRAAAQTIVENCANTLILRCSASENGGTAEFASMLIGQREVMQPVSSRTRQTGRLRSAHTTTDQVRIEPAVLASEIEQLPALEGFLKLASVPEWQYVRLAPGSWPTGPRRPSGTPPTTHVSPVIP